MRARAAVLAAALVSFGAGWAAWWAEDIRAPWSGVSVAVVVASLVVLGLAGGIRAVPLALLAVTVALTTFFAPWHGDAWGVPDDPSCDPSCGIDYPGSVILLGIPAMALAALGALLRAAARWRRWRRWRRGRYPAEPMSPGPP